MKIILSKLEDFYRKPRNNESLVCAIFPHSKRVVFGLYIVKSVNGGRRARPDDMHSHSNLIKSIRINANSHMASNNEIWNICTKFW
jgi:hypothetical protein